MTEQERQERMEKLFEKMLNMEMTNREIYEQCRNVAHKPMTNEEWIKQCTTEQLAEILVCMAEDKSETKTVHKENVGKCVWWLKQPHTPKE